MPYSCFEIVNNKQNLCAKVLALKVHHPMIDVFPLVRKLLDTPPSPKMVNNRNKGHHGQLLSKMHNKKSLLLKSSTHQNIIIAIPSRRDENFKNWNVPPFGFDEVRYMFDY